MQLLLGVLAKQSICTLQVLLEAPLKAGKPTYTLELLLGTLLKAE